MKLTFAMIALVAAEEAAAATNSTEPVPNPVSVALNNSVVMM